MQLAGRTSTARYLPAKARPVPCVRPSARASVAMAAIKLYTNPGSRGKMTEWALDELGLQYETVLLDMRSGQHKTSEYLAVNPFGKVPAIVDGDLPLFESGAILLHLANKYGKLTPDQLGVAAQWTLFANSTFSEAFFVRGPSASSAGLLKVLDGLLAKSTYITGESFSVADVALAGYLLYLPMFFPDFDLNPFPNVFRYMEACANRPTCPQPYKDAMQQALATRKPAGLPGGGNIFSRMMGGGGR